MWSKLPIRRAIGTSAAISFPVAIGGTLGYVLTGMGTPALPSGSLGYVYLPALAWTALASIFTAPLGAKATHHLTIGLLRKLFAVLLLALATKLLLKTLI
ncbi:MAG: TSUP family transporter, partial [Gallionella sp.]|nr:TSUP family transporter [Gallionella sp.]